jgi:hypothetical protein
MPLIYATSDVALGLNAPVRSFITPSKCTSISVINSSNLFLNVQTGQGAVPLPPYTTSTVPMPENSEISFTVAGTVITLSSSFPNPYVDCEFGFALHPVFSVRALPITSFTSSSSAVPTVGTGAIAAGAPILNPTFIVPSNGTILITCTLSAAAASAVLQVTRNNGGFYGNLNNGVALAALDETELTFYVADGDTVQMQFSAATDIGQIEVFFTEQQ